MSRFGFSLQFGVGEEKGMISIRPVFYFSEDDDEDENKTHGINILAIIMPSGFWITCTAVSIFFQTKKCAVEWG